MKIEKTDTLQEAIKKYGESAQTDKAVEEMAELTKALMKLRIAKTPADVYRARENVNEEIADVFIMLTQLEMIYSKPEAVQKVIDEKLTRLLRSLKWINE